MAQTSLRERVRIISFQENESGGGAWTVVPWVALRTALWILCFHSDSGGGEGLARGEGGGEAGGGEMLA